MPHSMAYARGCPQVSHVAFHCDTHCDTLRRPDRFSPALLVMLEKVILAE
jgi:hypothetical protein